MERLERLNGIDCPKLPIEVSSISYDQYEYQGGDIVYCDPPYQETKRYDNATFDHDAFWGWVRTRDYPVYVSEYSAPEDFVSIFKKEITRLMAVGNSAKTPKAIENIFINTRWRNNKQ